MTNIANYMHSPERYLDTGMQALYKATRKPLPLLKTPTFFDACAQNDLNTMDFYLEREVNPLIPDEQGRAPLELAYKYLGYEAIQLLNSHGVHLTRNFHKNILFVACICQDLKTISNLLPTFKCLNDTDSMGNTPLDLLVRIKAPQKEGIEIYNLLKANGAKINVMGLKFLAHFLGIKGKIMFNGFELDLETSSSFLTAIKLPEVAIPFLKREAPQYGISDCSDILEEISYNLTKDPAALAAEIKSGKTVVLLTGWKGHMTALVFAGGNLVMKCNRGSGSGKTPGVLVFEMTKKENLEEILRELQDKNKKFFLETMDESLGLKFRDYLQQKKQKIENCTTATAKTVVHALLYFEFFKKHKDQRLASLVAYDVYKDWTQKYLRPRIALEYLSGDVEPAILQLMLQKCARR